MGEQTPEGLLGLILNSNRDKQLEICTTALDASQDARKCFMDGHIIEIYNLRAHIRELSIALVDLANGNPIDRSLFAIARTNVEENVVVTDG